MSRDNLWGLDVKRIARGHYTVNGYHCEDVKGTTGWRLQDGDRDRWFGTFMQCKSWIAQNRRAA